MTMETNKNIEQLLEMLDHPERYSEQEILDIINQDDETRETYRQLVRAKRVSRHHRSAVHPADVDQAWQQFEQRYMPQPKRERPWLKMVATLAGILLVSGIAWAAVYAVRHYVTDKPKATTETVTPAVPTESTVTSVEVATSDSISTAAMEPVVFDEVTLGQMLDEIAAYYGKEVAFRSDEARQLRFHFVWNKADGLDKVLEDLQHFERVDVEQKENLLIVQ